MGHDRLRNAAVAFLFIVIAACSSNSPKETVVPVADNAGGGGYVGERTIYANLVSERGGSWVFTTVTDSETYFDKGYLVRLNDLTPAFDIRVAECMPQVYPDGHRCSPTHPFRDKDSGVLDKIISGSIAVGTAGKVTDIKQTYETSFNEADFNRAVDEAMVNTGMDVDRRELIALVEQYDSSASAARTELAELSRKMSKTRNEANRVELNIQPAMQGLTEYYRGDIDFRQLVDLSVADGVDNPVVKLEEDPILPCEARRCLAKAETATAALQQQIEEHKSWLGGMIQPDTRVYNVHCDNVSYGDYLLSTSCPAQIIVSGPEATNLPISVNILARDFAQLYPSFDLADHRLQVAINSQSVTFANLTDEYVTLTAQTIYYNSQVHNTAISIDVPPGISVTRDMREFASQAIDIESSYRQMTPDKADGSSFQFGFAVRYRVASESEEQTLHQLQSFNVGCVIRNQSSPGSCKPEAVAEAETEEEDETRDDLTATRTGPM